MKRSVNGTGLAERRVGAEWGARLLGLAVLAVTAVWLPSAAWADEAAQPAAAARLSNVDGQVQLSQGGQVIADQAVVNAPLFQGTRVATSESGRAEIQFDDGSVARLSPNSSLTLTVLRGQGSVAEAEISLESGLGYFELQGAGQGAAIRIRFGDSLVTSGGFTVLRINRDSTPGELAVFSGNAHLERGNAMSVDLHGGESVALNAGDPAKYELSESIEPDSWDSWNSDRDQVLTAEAASKTAATKGFAGSNNPAWNDLDANGNWYNVPGQGNIWSPYDASNPGWDPYGSGNWMYTQGYGYLWASGNPWGYLPYNCGTWNYYDAFGWGWGPGAGGCSPWWGGGVGFFRPNIGVGFGGYRPPRPPHTHMPPAHSVAGGGAVQRAYPVVAVNHRSAFLSNGSTLQDRSGPVTIAGHTVQPLQPLAPRPQYARTSSAVLNGNSAVSASATARMAGKPIGAAGPGVSLGRSGYSVNSTPARASASNGFSQHAATPSHSSPSGGYSGGASSAGHASAGGGGFSGGGGGGGSHGGGGGGGGGSHR